MGHAIVGVFGTLRLLLPLRFVRTVQYIHIVYLHLLFKKKIDCIVYAKFPNFSFLPESMRWLLSQGRIDEVIQMLNKVADINEKQVPAEIIQKFKVKFPTCYSLHISLLQ